MNDFWHSEDIVLSSKRIIRSVANLSLLNELIYFLKLLESAWESFYYFAF